MTTTPVVPAAGDVPGESKRSRIGWGRAVVSGLVLVLLGFLVCAYVPDFILKHANMGRSERADLAAAVTLVGVVAMAWLLRRLQRRGVI